MWNRRESEAEGGTATAPATEIKDRPSAWERPASMSSPSATSTSHSPASPSRREGMIGKSIHIRGELTGNEDLTIEGKVEGKIDLMDHNLTIGPSGRIEAEVGAKSVIVQGQVTGNVSAGERVELTATGRVKGDVHAPRVIIADGAHFKGMVNMTGADEKSERGTGAKKKDSEVSRIAAAEAPGQAAKSA